MTSTEPLYPNCDFSIWFRSASEKTVDEIPIEGKKTGYIPEWINGSFYQNGPGLLDVTGERVKHLFDAFSLIQKFTIEHGSITYQNRILLSDAYQKALSTGEAHYAEYGTGRSDSLENPPNGFKRLEATSSWLLSRIRQLISGQNDFRTDNAMISVYPYVVDHERTAVFAMTETTIMHEVDSTSIETRTKFNVSEYLPVVTHCAHPVVLNDGKVINVGLGSSLTGMNYIVFEFPGHPEAPTTENLMEHCRVLTKIPSRWPFNPAYMHTFGVTDNYIILIEQSLCISLTQMVQVTITNEPMTNALIWHENEPSRFRVIDRRTMREKTDFIYLTAAFFFLHSINAYEDEDHLVVDICCYENADMLKCMTIEALEQAQQNPEYRKQFRGRPKRFVLPLTNQNRSNDNLVTLKYTSCKVKPTTANKLWIVPETILDVGCELPQIHRFGHAGKFYQYFYAINSDIDYEYCGAIRKIDILSKTCQVWYEEGCYASEPVFLRNPLSDKDESEDDGVLIFSLLRSDCANEVNLVVLNAQTMKEMGRVQFFCKGPVPKCLHGLWNGTPVN